MTNENQQETGKIKKSLLEKVALVATLGGAGVSVLGTIGIAGTIAHGIYANNDPNYYRPLLENLYVTVMAGIPICIFGEETLRPIYRERYGAKGKNDK